MVQALVVLVFLVTNLFAQTTEEPKGWYKAKWGMQEQELIEAFKEDGIKKDKRKEYKGGYSTLRLDGYSLAGEIFDVNFVMDSTSNVLSTVVLSLKDGGSETQFFSLKQKLVEKYGKPAFESEKKSAMVTLKAAWNFPTTNIELAHLNFRMEGFKKLFSIVYSRSVKEEKL